MKLLKISNSMFLFQIALFFTSCILIAGCATTATVHSWTKANNPAEFPEAGLGLPSTGVCFSGGGTRAMNCALGQMKGLDSAKLWDHIGYVSAVSGGSWATSIFTYYRAGAENDKQLLGNIVPPQNCTMENLHDMPKGFMGHVITRGFFDNIFGDLGLDLVSLGLLEKKDNIWIDAVGNTYLKEYGLYDSENPAYFTLNDSTRDAILKRNPTFKTEDFITVHNRISDIKRPFMIINSSLLAPAKDLPIHNPENLSVFNYTPLYIGSNTPLQVSDKNLNFGDSLHFNAGGGFVESFGFGGSYVPGKINHIKANNYGIRVKLAKDRFRIVDATGTSSAAFGATVSSNFLMQLAAKVITGISLDKLVPEQEYWPIKPGGDFGTNEKYRFTDGGNLENYGLITLLQRGVGKIVVFVNSATPLNVNSLADTNCALNLNAMDPDMYPLFGFSSGNQIHNQVFDSKSFYTVYDSLSEAKKQGKTVMTKTTLKTVENKWWGIKAGNSVEILWVYNEFVNDWACQLPKSVQNEINNGSAGKFPDFPLYKLIFEDGVTKGISFSNAQVNLLYQLSAWNVYHNAEVFDFLKSK